MRMVEDYLEETMVRLHHANTNTGHAVRNIANTECENPRCMSKSQEQKDKTLTWRLQRINMS